MRKTDGIVLNENPKQMEWKQKKEADIQKPKSNFRAGGIPGIFRLKTRTDETDASLPLKKTNRHMKPCQILVVSGKP